MPSNNPQDKSARTEIAPAKGKLGIMIPGMGAVATTFVAGVEAIRKGTADYLNKPISLATLRDRISGLIEAALQTANACSGGNRPRADGTV